MVIPSVTPVDVLRHSLLFFFFFFLMIRRPPRSTLFPYTTSSDLGSQGKITSEECNDIIRKLNLKSFESEYKILLMWTPELMGPEGNKLLKLIEEPPPNTLFILVTENEQLVLSTIVSRCQLIRIPALSVSDVEMALVNRHQVEANQARQIAGIAEGNFRIAYQMIQQTED